MVKEMNIGKLRIAIDTEARGGLSFISNSIIIINK